MSDARPAPATGAPVVVVSRFLPDPAGPAGARLLHGFVTGARSLSRAVEVWSWWPYDATGPVPEWCHWRPLPDEPAWRRRGLALVRPRSDVVLDARAVPPEAVAVAEEVLSAPAVAGHPHAVLTVHHLTALDRRALGTLSPTHLQDLRADRRVRRSPGVLTAYSPRVAAHLGRRALAVPAAIDVPDAPLPGVDEPTVGCVADWRWEPNRVALHRLLAAWPEVVRAVPRARLLLAGYGDAGVGGLPGVQVLGAVRDSSTVLDRCAALVFPCPDTSGPKVKVMEALALGVPVLTTPAGVEGLAVDGTAYRCVPQPAAAPVLAAAITSLLTGAEARHRMATAGRDQLRAGHSPEVAAAARLAAIDGALIR